MNISNFTYEAASGLVTGKFIDKGTGAGIQPATLSYMIYQLNSPQTVIKILTALTPVSTYVDANGNLLFYIIGSDNPIQDNSLDREIHVLRLVWTWTAQGNPQTGKEEIPFEIINLTPN